MDLQRGVTNVTEFKKDDPLDCFKPRWCDHKKEWEFLHLLNGKTYTVMTLVYMRLCENMKVYPLYEKYRHNALETCRYEMSSVFFMHWLREMHWIWTVERAELERQLYLEENPKKGKQSEAVYSKTVEDYMRLFRDME
jgi:hypothetical protein